MTNKERILNWCKGIFALAWAGTTLACSIAAIYGVKEKVVMAVVALISVGCTSYGVYKFVKSNKENL